jgi:large subunit ribosomal protein L15
VILERNGSRLQVFIVPTYSKDNGESRMPHKKRKTRKERGERTHGYGIIGQHRGGGQRGGKGKAGGKKHGWTYTVKYTPERFGKHGFKPPRRKMITAINVGELDQQISKLISGKEARKTKEGIKVDLSHLGYDKLLGRGQVTQPLIVQVDSHSKSAAEKIQEAGGKILETAQ